MAFGMCTIYNQHLGYTDRDKKCHMCPIRTYLYPLTLKQNTQDSNPNNQEGFSLFKRLFEEPLDSYMSVTMKSFHERENQDKKRVFKGFKEDEDFMLMKLQSS